MRILKKLNNRGVIPMSTMLIFLIIFFIFILVVAILATRMGITDDDDLHEYDRFVPDSRDVIFE